MPLPGRKRGGYARGFGTARFILDYLDGQGGKYGVDTIEPAVGAPQVEIHYHYKEALRRYAVEQQAQHVEERQARREGRRYNPDNVTALTEQLLEKPIRRLSRMTYASFVVYFRNLKHLGWVEPTGQTEPSAIQYIYTQSGSPAPADAYPRILYRVTSEGRSAPEDAVSDPLQAIYGYEAAQRSSRVPLPSVPRVSEARAASPGVVTVATYLNAARRHDLVEYTGLTRPSANPLFQDVRFIRIAPGKGDDSAWDTLLMVGGASPPQQPTQAP